LGEVRGTSFRKEYQAIEFARPRDGIILDIFGEERRWQVRLKSRGSRNG